MDGQSLAGERTRVRGQRLGQQRARSKAGDAQWRDIEPADVAVEDQFGQHPTSRRTVLEAMARKAIRAVKASHRRDRADDRVIVGADIVQAGPRLVAEAHASQWRHPPGGELRDAWQTRPINVGIETRVRVARARHQDAGALATKVPTHLKVNDQRHFRDHIQADRLGDEQLAPIALDRYVEASHLADNTGPRARRIDDDARLHPAVSRFDGLHPVAARIDAEYFDAFADLNTAFTGPPCEPLHRLVGPGQRIFGRVGSRREVIGAHTRHELADAFGLHEP